jgi:adenosylcobyric acid synthase
MTIPLGRTIMIQGTASDVGKSTLVTALCRMFANDGYRVAPFKAQNMSLNAAVTTDGREIGRAQFAQAEAARIPASADMNPILLKPTDDRQSQVVVLGRVLAEEEARDYYERRDMLWPIVTGCLDRLRAANDIVVVEGAGSPAEINLASRDIVNMRVARYAQAPVVLVGDIERGGVFAALYGTTMLLEPDERRLVRGYVINKFRGDDALLAPGPAMLEARTGIPTIGVLPWLHDVGVADEDSLALPRYRAATRSIAPGDLDVAVIEYPYIANFDDLDPLRRTPGVSIRFVTTRAAFGNPALIILPGSKSTVADLHWLRATGLADDIVAARRAGTPVIGICGGFQMLGRALLDPDRVESSTSRAEGLGLLPATTTFEAEKRTEQVHGVVGDRRGLLANAGDAPVSAYEIHMGQTIVDDPHRAAFTVSTAAGPRPDGVLDADGLTLGCYLHGLFHNEAVRDAVLAAAAAAHGLRYSPTATRATCDAYDELATLVRERLDIAAIRRWLELPATDR